MDDKSEYKYQCKDCGMLYKTKELAEACLKWCTEHKSCNLEIIKQGLASRDLAKPDISPEEK